MPNIKIRAMHDNFSTLGLFLEDGKNYLCPKLLPGQIVEVPDDHPVFSSPARVHIELTNEEATRPYAYGTLHEAMSGQGMSENDAVEASQMIGTSLEMSAKIRQDNFAALQKAKAEGVEIPAEPQLPGDDGLSAPRNDNAEAIGAIGKEAEAAAAAPPASGGRKRRRGKG